MILQAVQEIWGATSDIVATLTLIPQHSKPNQFICRRKYVISQSLVKFRPLQSKISC